MTAVQRRNAIYDQLTHATAPLSATALAQQFSVTRQVVVGDIALLRAEGYRITATPCLQPQCRRHQAGTVCHGR